MRHAQEERNTSMKEEQKCLPEERCKRMNEQNQLLNEEEEKFKERIDFHEDEIKEEIPKLPTRKHKNFSRMAVAELEQKVVTNLYGTFALIFLSVFLGNINSRIFPINSKKKTGYAK
ncbi:hypothetical protein TNCV_2066341 [Trichonephila clavipes]|nr:hypothetical protein TNCV_2066341 [Trichonephila clavipes]